MIAKCIVVLAIVAQINANVISGGQTVATRNIVARGKYPVVLQNPGPAIDKRVPVTTSHVQTPVQVKPTVRLPACIPAPKTVSHTCTCYKTVMRPTVQQQYITVPSVQRYIETTHQPVVEHIHYEACPVNCPDTVSEVAYARPMVGNVVGVATPVQVASAVPVATFSTGCQQCV
ncbi:hypothetical protein Phum_PHUM146150 [Pediculus humanus corporis]|uniref:Uncharacterized protein n=1 Tax=Pediculus humanus subsp. corporis TaxID=121224 RepID=E0VEW6_PEDHC|nr:uncharacterized protein Phum_PHUM146150 [Pediculus humanus corporis]EEB11940.1 hypothetical protein Phum_PHUM146150 [Pediculus humanus corporis]